jgi:hypothetical protein
MTTSIFRAWGLGVAILVAAHLLWFAFLQAEQYSGAALAILWSSPAIASFVTAYLAPRRKMLVASSLALPTVLLVVSLNASHAALGNVVDFPGAKGALYLSAITLAWSALVCVLGGGVGSLLTRMHSPAP